MAINDAKYQGGDLLRAIFARENTLYDSTKNKCVCMCVCSPGCTPSPSSSADPQPENNGAEIVVRMRCKLLMGLLSKLKFIYIILG